MSKLIIPNTELKAFSCPHCDAIADQTWYDTLGSELTREDKTPFKVRLDIEEHLKTVSEHEISQAAKKELLLRFKRELAGEVFFHGAKGSNYSIELKNLHISKCFSCKKLSVWIAHKLAWPETKFEIRPSADMPEIVKRDFEEAALIFKKSPRSAAALLRLATEKLCNELNGTKDSVFEGIGKLVKKGLDPKIQKALDIVRVTGNDAVHPGQINLNDTPEVAERLFKLVNVIVESLITVPKEIDNIYDTISDEKKEAIQKRDS